MENINRKQSIKEYFENKFPFIGGLASLNLQEKKTAELIYRELIKILDKMNSNQKEQFINAWQNEERKYAEKIKELLSDIKKKQTQGQEVLEAKKNLRQIINSFKNEIFNNQVILATFRDREYLYKFFQILELTI